MLLPLLLTVAAPKAIDLYLGTYTSPEGSRGIYRTRLDLETGALSKPELAVEAESPSYLAFAPDGRTLYAVHETGEGGVGAYRIDPDGGLRTLNVQPSGGGYPCHLSVGEKALFVANYGGGSLAVLPLGDDGALGKPTVVPNRGSGPNKGRQEGPHLHFAEMRHGRLYACDLGTDEILVYPFANGALGEPDRTKTHPGAGPRHLAFSRDGRFAYANDELDNTVVAYAVDPYGALTALQTLSSLPEGFAGASHSAEIALHPDGRWLYVSNRGHESLAVFGVGADGTLSPVAVQDAGVKEPRGFGIDPTGRWMVVAGQNDDGVSTLPIDPKTGRLGGAAGRIALGKPVCVVFRPVGR